MTRINTNVDSLRGLRNLQKSNSMLQTSLQRLSTGLKINNGKDNPSGLIASEGLRLQITTIEQSIKNSNRANNVIATADSALGEIGGLLNQIRGLIQEGLNVGALSQEEIEANQSQIDAALSAINRISANTTFGGDKLIDGSKAFITSLTTADAAKLSDFRINEAVLGTADSLDVEATVTTVAERASLIYTGRDLSAAATLEIGGSQGNEVLFLGANATSANIVSAVNSLSESTGVQARIVAGTSVQAATNLQIGGEEVYVTLTQAGADLAAGGSLSVELVDDASGTTATTATLRDDGNGAYTIVVELEDDGLGGITGSDVDEVLAAIATVVDSDGNQLAAGSLADGAVGTTDVTAVVAETELDNGTLRIDDVRGPNATGTISVVFADPGAADQTLSLSITTSGDDTTITVNLATDANNIITSTIADVVDLLGSSTELLADGETTVAEAVQAYTEGDDTALVSPQAESDLDTTNGATIALESTDYGSSEFVNVNVLSGTFATLADDYSTETRRDEGVDIGVTINGQTTYGRGLAATVRTSNLDAYVSFSESSNVEDESVTISITGGGSLFQIGQEPTAAGQIGVGIEAINTARLGGIAGKLYELGTGRGKSLVDIVDGNASGNEVVKIVEQALDRVSSLRGRLGALQKNVIETNITTLGVALENITDARSQIVDTEFAEETAQLQKAQILSQAGLSVLAIANQNPQQVLSLLR
jgi:flagellin